MGYMFCHNIYSLYVLFSQSTFYTCNFKNTGSISAKFLGFVKYGINPIFVLQSLKVNEFLAKLINLPTLSLFISVAFRHNELKTFHATKSHHLLSCLAVLTAKTVVLSVLLQCFIVIKPRYK